MELALILVGIIIWLFLLWFLGIPTLAKRRYVLFALGIPIPIFWAFGALLPARG